MFSPAAQAFEAAEEPNCFLGWRLKYQQLRMTMKSQSGRALKREPLEASGKGKSISLVIFCLPGRASEARHEDRGQNLPLKILTIIICLMAQCNSHSRKGQRHLSGVRFYISWRLLITLMARIPQCICLVLWLLRCTFTGITSWTSSMVGARSMRRCVAGFDFNFNPTLSAYITLSTLQNVFMASWLQNEDGDDTALKSPCEGYTYCL